MSSTTSIDAHANRQVIDEHKSNMDRMILYDCVICNRHDITEQDIKKHHQEHHQNIPIDQDIFLPVEFITKESKLFNCVVCNAKNIKENDRKHHHLNLHKDVRLDRNIFKLIEIQRKSVRKATKVTAKANLRQRALKASSTKTGPIDGHKAMDKILATGDEIANSSTVSHEVPKFIYDSKQFDTNSGRENFTNKMEVRMHTGPRDPNQPMVLLNCITPGIPEILPVNKFKIIGDIKKDSNDLDVDLGKLKVQCNVCGELMEKRQLKTHMNAHPKVTTGQNQSTNDSVSPNTEQRSVLATTSIQNKGRHFGHKAMMNGRCSICHQRIDEAQFAKHLKQKHPATLIPLIARWLNAERYTTSSDLEDLEDDDSEIISDIGKESNELNVDSDTPKLMSYSNEVVPAYSVNQTVKQNLTAQKIEMIEHISALKLYKCVICQVDGIKEQNMVKHWTKKHSNIPTLDQMFELSTKEQPDKCDICCAVMKPGFLSEHKRRIHPKICSDDKDPSNSHAIQPLPVKKSSNADILNMNSSKAYGASDIFEQNLMEHHSQKLGQTPLELNKPQKIYRFCTTAIHFYECVHCNDDNLSKDQLVSHSREHHDDVRRIDYHMIVTLEQVRCLCGNTIWADKFVKHMRQWHPLVQYTCVDQNGQLIGKNLEAVEDIPEVQVKMFKCNACQAKNILKEDLDGHRRNKHSQVSVTFDLMLPVNKKQCKLCHMMIKETKFENHMKWYHPRQKDVVKIYKCDLCDTWSVGRNHKKKHARAQKDNGFEENHFKFPCDTCGRRMCVGRQKKHHLKTCLQYANKMNMYQVKFNI